MWVIKFLTFAKNQRSRVFTVTSGQRIHFAARLLLVLCVLRPVGSHADDLSTVENSIGMQFVKIESGEFMMGSPENEPGRSPREKQRKVKIARPFYMGAYEVTQQQYQTVMGKNPSAFSAEGGFRERVKGVDTRQFPVDSTNWHNAQEFCRRLSNLPKEKEAARNYRLPSEAQWEYACRAGTQTVWSFGHDPQMLKHYAVYGEREAGRPHAVGSRRPNAWGLHDMHGNVWEWCADPYIKMETAENESQPSRVIRGGSWFSVIANTRSATRLGDPPGVGDPDTGFRVLLEIQRER